MRGSTDTKAATLILPYNYDGQIWLHRSRERSDMIAEHRHNELELNFVIQGHAHVLMTDRRYSLKTDDLAWIFPEQDHLLTHRSHDFEMWTLVFNPDLFKCISPAKAATPFKQQNPQVNTHRQLNAEEASRLHQLCQIGLQQQKCNRPELFNAALLHILLSAWSYYESGKMPGSADAYANIHPAVEQAMNLLRSKQPPQDIQQLSKAVGLSANHMGSLFKQETGLSIVHFRNQLRLREFFQLHTQFPDRNILSLALQSGFGSYAQFHRVFCHDQGISPRKWKNKQSSI